MPVHRMGHYLVGLMFGPTLHIIFLKLNIFSIFHLKLKFSKCFILNLKVSKAFHKISI